jgi:hypothetical protein
MNRREALRLLGMGAAIGAIDPLELIERLAPRRIYVPGHDFSQRPLIVQMGHAQADLNAVWRKVRHALEPSFNFTASEWDMLDITRRSDRRTQLTALRTC